MKRFLTISAYIVLVAIVLFASTCESHVTITTPEKDATILKKMASTIRSEADLRDVENLARKYEIAYRNSINVATALEYKRLVEPILVEAGDRRDAIREEEEAKATMLAKFEQNLEDRERAWSMKIGSKSEAQAMLADNNKKIESLKSDIEAMAQRKEDLATEIVEQGYPEALLTELGKLEDEIASIELSIADIEHENSIIILSRKLQYGEDIEAEVVMESASESVKAAEPNVNIIIEPIEERIYEESF